MKNEICVHLARKKVDMESRPQHFGYQGTEKEEKVDQPPVGLMN